MFYCCQVIFSPIFIYFNKKGKVHALKALPSFMLLTKCDSNCNHLVTATIENKLT